MDQPQKDELLLYCLRVVPDEMGDGRLEALSSSDWDVLIELSGRYGIAPLLYHRLITFHPGILIPESAIGRLRQAYLESVARNMGLYHELGKLQGSSPGNGSVSEHRFAADGRRRPAGETD